ncbi:glutaredoxin family protein [Undibacterium macrobrachii]|nr:glutaredoxin family protein [Undibacterium macrobrachii]
MTQEVIITLSDFFVDALVMLQFTLYSRSYCHLCDDMLVQLKSALQAIPHLIEVIDVDADEKLVAQFDELVPVLFARKGEQEARQICHYFLDEVKLKAYLNEH